MIFSHKYLSLKVVQFSFRWWNSNLDLQHYVIDPLLSLTEHSKFKALLIEKCSSSNMIQWMNWDLKLRQVLWMKNIFKLLNIPSTRIWNKNAGNAISLDRSSFSFCVTVQETKNHSRFLTWYPFALLNVHSVQQ